ncbi:prenylated protein, putative [Plasmodium ovale wallikeri]|uniref:Prenylated protein, putative n=1 Tax=Plasmodium ovale wallikeri TaxID=864142 RepID=A0A1A8YP96_PLAOA|nr:prenylated protein, putative [Plasmodium ovale wallikeri]SBT33756.1 prenylated protein, putative [Plasmodium ovale wallikeri]
MDFIRSVPKKEWSEVKQDNKISFNLNSYLEKYKDPLACDAIAQTNIKISENIEKVRVTMDTLIRNRENLDVLVDKSKDLSSNFFLLLLRITTSLQLSLQCIITHQYTPLGYICVAY